MTEVVYRRYKRLLDENHPLPQLIIIDGGKGQLGAAMESLHVLGITHMVKVIGIAKKLEEIFVPGDSVPIYLNKKSESLKLIQHARNEAHRFAISFHRNQRSKNFLKNRLENITGIGPKTAQKLLKEYGSVERIKIVNLEELTAFIGQKLAETVLKELNQ